MDAETFSGHFEQLVVQPAAQAGFVPWGKSLWLARDGVEIAVLRTESRHMWPFELTLVLRHDCLRDFKDRVPPPPSRDPSEYPVKAPPSRAGKLVKRYRYRPYNLGRFPSDEMPYAGDEHAVRERLRAIGETLVEATPLLVHRLTPDVLVREIQRRGEGAWAENRWLEDYRSYLAARGS